MPFLDLCNINEREELMLLNYWVVQKRTSFFPKFYSALSAYDVWEKFEKTGGD